MDIVNMRVGGNLEGLKDFVKFIQKFGDTKEMTLLEIGSFKGESSEIFAQNFKRITCVDSWIGASVEMYLNNCTAKDIENAFDERMKVYDNVKKMKMTSKEASEKIKSKFDIVYIDAAHDYGNVKLDIELWKDRAKLIISGHDYSVKHKGVIKAVNEMFYMPDEKFKDNSWLVWKNRNSETLKYKYNENYTLNRIEGAKEFKAGKIHQRKIDIANTFDIKGKNVLDVGFGRGELLRLCKSKGAFCYGIDYSKDAFNIAKSKDLVLFNDHVINIKKYFEGAEHVIDIVFMIDIVEHITEKEFDEFINELIPLLSNGCKIFVHTPKDIHAGDIYNMHITQWTKEKLLNKFSMFTGKVKENKHNYYFVGTLKAIIPCIPEDRE